MKIKHHDLLDDLDDAWWAEAGMLDFKPSTSAYHTDPHKFQSAFEVRIENIAPVGMARRKIGIFRDSIDEGRTARERVLYILRAFHSGAALEPVEVVRGQPGCLHQYELYNGTHRLYCSLAAGFVKVPAIEKVY